VQPRAGVPKEPSGLGGCQRRAPLGGGPGRMDGLPGVRPGPWAREPGQETREGRGRCLASQPPKCVPALPGRSCGEWLARRTCAAIEVLNLLAGDLEEVA
jgi:hypothetical protein